MDYEKWRSGKLYRKIGAIDVRNVINHYRKLRRSFRFDSVVLCLEEKIESCKEMQVFFRYYRSDRRYILVEKVQNITDKSKRNDIDE